VFVPKPSTDKVHVLRLNDVNIATIIQTYHWMYVRYVLIRHHATKISDQTSER